MITDNLQAARHCLTLPAEGQQLRYCGVGAGFDDVIVDGDLDAMKVSRPWLRRWGTLLIEPVIVYRVLCERRQGYRSC